MKTSCVSHPPSNHFVKIYDWQIQLLDGDVTGAALLSFFEYWHNVKLALQPKAVQANRVAEMHGDIPAQDTSLYQWHTEAEIEFGVKISKRSTISISLKKLVQKGFVSIHKNPNPKYAFDKTRHFLFHPEAVNLAIARLSDHPKISLPEPENKAQSPENKAQSPENKAAIPKTSSKTSSKEEIKDALAFPNLRMTAESRVTGEETGLALPNNQPLSTLLLDQSDHAPLPSENGSQKFEAAFNSRAKHSGHTYPEAQALAQMGLPHLWVGPGRNDYAPELIEAIRAKKQEWKQPSSNTDIFGFIRNRIRDFKHGGCDDGTLQDLYDEGTQILGNAKSAGLSDAVSLGWQSAELSRLERVLEAEQAKNPNSALAVMAKRQIDLLTTNPEEYRSKILCVTN